MGSQRGGKRRGGRYQQAPNLLVSAVSSPHYQQFNKASPNTMPKVWCILQSHPSWNLYITTCKMFQGEVSVAHGKYKQCWFALWTYWGYGGRSGCAWGESLGCPRGSEHKPAAWNATHFKVDSKLSPKHLQVLPICFSEQCTAAWNAADFKVTKIQPIGDRD